MYELKYTSTKNIRVLAAICWAIWKARNKACFEFKCLKHPAEIICHACSFLKFWTGLHKEEFQAQIRDGVDVLLSVACQMIANQRQDLPRLLPPPTGDHSGDQESE